MLQHVTYSYYVNKYHLNQKNQEARLKGKAGLGQQSVGSKGEASLGGDQTTAGKGELLWEAASKVMVESFRRLVYKPMNDRRPG